MLLVCAFLFSISAFFALPSDKTENETTPFAAKLVEIYRKYDTDENGVSSRLILSDYSGDKTYGASDYAIDKKNSFAVLQYESEKEAKRAMKEIESDGIVAEQDSKATLNSFEKGSLYPAGSNALGTPSYISKFKMDKEDVIVAVIDTGVMYDHEFMENRFVSRGYDFSDDGRNNAYYDTNMSNSYSHGTLVCGIIADNTPDNVKMLPYKVVPFGATDASNSALAAAIYDAVDKGASVINISMSTTSGGNAYKYAVKNALDNNVCVCASAGNEKEELRYRYPAVTPGVITVTALESDMQTFASFSNYGSAVDFCAPGRKIVSTCPYKSGEDKFMSSSGTSFSAPYISAVCANIKSINNDYTKDEVYSVICDFAQDLGEEGRDNYYGNGLPNLSDMVYTDDETYSCAIPEGELEILANTNDYTAETQPWRLFADRIPRVSIDEKVDEIGAYTFNNMKKAEINISDTYKSVGDYAFYSCKSIKSVAFDENITRIGEKAFGGLDDDFYISGYRNTAAEVYAQRESISFNALGCKHNYFAEVFDPTEEAEGYTVYTCSVCGDYYIGAYIEPPEYYEGECGMGVYWRYTTKTKTLEISGSGYMYSYQSAAEVPWNAFMNKITDVVIGESITFISDYILCNAANAKTFKVMSKNASLSENTVTVSEESLSMPEIFAFEDSAAKDFLCENGIEYTSLGCGHSRRVDYCEEQPSCCYDTYGVHTCADCGNIYKEYISLESKGHYLSGSITTLGFDSINAAEVYLDGELSAITNAKGKYIIYPVLCGEHSVLIKKNERIIESFNVTVSRENNKSVSRICYGDYDGNGCINAKDFAFAVRNGFDDAKIIDIGDVKANECTNEGYELQELPYTLSITNIPNEENPNGRKFIAVIENNSEFEIKESGFVYGKNMPDEMLYISRVGEVNSDGYTVKMKAATNNYAYEKVLAYSTKSGTLSARFYIIYTNGVKDYLTYSEVSSYTYPEADEQSGD